MRPLADPMDQSPGATEDAAPFRPETGHPKAEAPKVHIGFRLAADVVESLKASGPGYNARVEEALRQAGFGARASAAKKRVAKQERG